MLLSQKWNNVIKALLVLNPASVIYVLTTSKGSPKGPPPRGRVKVVQTFRLKKVSHGLGGLHCIVEWNFMKEMVDAMCRTKVVMEKIEDGKSVCTTSFMVEDLRAMLGVCIKIDV